MNKPFRNRFSGPRLSPEEAARQGRATSLAFDTLGKSDAVIAFLNTDDPALGGRPLDLAIASPEGLLSVERALAARKTA
ncbi:antitoxin Xre/MbcA/ParS toxin-binding domain-containing protein [Sphingomonas sp. ASY06-1R]|jgi:uncharacterized protein (DUF2384 family)|uniref:antitoxin Xre/MbcA/ParS toxin-binding domain-containing protein n=1 Tax=Sphingomonas sp. ASY06-1R TaxID=3445771 RepID=UPI003FA2E200